MKLPLILLFSLALVVPPMHAQQAKGKKSIYDQSGGGSEASGGSSKKSSSKKSSSGRSKKSSGGGSSSSGGSRSGGGSSGSGGSSRSHHSEGEGGSVPAAYHELHRHGGGYSSGGHSSYGYRPSHSWSSFSVTRSAPVYYSTPTYYESAPRTVYYESDRAAYGTGVGLDVQEELSRLGYRVGPIDGVIGPTTRRAIAQYQADNGLRVTGRIDEILLRDLGLIEYR